MQWIWEPVEALKGQSNLPALPAWSSSPHAQGTDGFLGAWWPPSRAAIPLSLGVTWEGGMQMG